MADNLAYTPGAGSLIKTDQDGGDGSHMQIIKLAISSDGISTLIPSTAGYGLTVDVTRVAGAVLVNNPTAANLKVDASGVAVPVTDNAGSLTVDAPVATPVFVRLSDGASAIAALPVTDNAGSLTVDAPVATPVFVRLSDGTNAIAALPVTDNAGSLTVDALKTAPVGIRLSDGTDWIAALPVTDNGGSLTVDGAVTANQGTAAVVANAWPTKISDGTDTVGISTVSAAKALKVDVVQTVAVASQTDKSAFVEGTGKCDVAGGVVNDTIGSDPTEDQAAALRLTTKRGLHVNIRKLDGTELGIAATPLRTDPTGTTTQPVSGTVTATLDTATNAGAAAKKLDYDTGAGTDTVTVLGIALPKSGGAVAGGTSTDPLRVDPTGTTIQPVSGTVTANQGTANATPWNENLAQIATHAVVEAANGIQKIGLSDEAGVTFSHANPLPVAVVPQEDSAQWRAANTYAASETDVAIRTPSGGKKFVVLGVIISCTGTGVLKIFDGSNAAANMLFQGTPVAALAPTVIAFATPWKSSTANNVLRYSTGTGATGDITLYGYEV